MSKRRWIAWNDDCPNCGGSVEVCTDPEHKGKHYCPDCFKEDPEDEDKIIIDLTRAKTPNQ